MRYSRRGETTGRTMTAATTIATVATCLAPTAPKPYSLSRLRCFRLPRHVLA